VKKKIELLDGATGTRLWALAGERGYDRVPTWRYNLEHPELVEQVVREYIAAGSTIVCSNSFAANRMEFRHFADAPAVGDVVAAAVRIAKAACAGTDTKVALDVGPLPQMMEPFGDLTAETAVDCYAEILAGGMREHPDLIFFETFTDLTMLCAAMQAAKRYDVPVFCSLSFERSGKTLMGNSPEEIAETLERGGAAAIGLNCSFGPAAALPVIRAMAERTGLPLILKPNVDEGTTAEMFAEEITHALPLISYMGACCGSSPEYIARLRELTER